MNNACYSHYVQHARHEFLAYLGVSADAIARQGDALALSELNLKYLQPLRSGDKFRATCRVVKATGARLVMSQRVLRQPRAGEDSEVVSGQWLCVGGLLPCEGSRGRCLSVLCWLPPGAHHLKHSSEVARG